MGPTETPKTPDRNKESPVKNRGEFMSELDRTRSNSGIPLTAEERTQLERDWEIFVENETNMPTVKDLYIAPNEWRETMQKFIQMPMIPHIPDQDPRKTSFMHTYDELIKNIQLIRRGILTMENLRQRLIDGSVDPSKKEELLSQYSTLTMETLRALTIYLADRQQYDQSLGLHPAGKIQLPDFLEPFSMPDFGTDTTINIAESLIQMQYDVADQIGLAVAPLELSPKCDNIMRLATVNRIRMRDVVPTCLKEDGTVGGTKDDYVKLLERIGMPVQGDNEIHAMKLILGYLGKHKKNIDQYASVMVFDPGNLLFQDALACCTHVKALGDAAARLGPEIKKAFAEKRGVDLSGLLKQAGEDTRVHSDQMLKVMLAPVYKLKPDANEEDRKHFFDSVEKVALHFFRGFCSDMQLKYIIDSQKDPSNRSISLDSLRNDQMLTMKMGMLDLGEKGMARHVIASVCNENTLLQLLKSVDIPPPDKQTDSSHIEITKALSTLILKPELRIRLKDVLEVYYYTNIEDGGSLLVTLKTIELLKDYGFRALATDMEAKFVGRVGEMVMAEGMEGVAKVLDELHLTEAQKRELKNISLWLRDEKIELVFGAWEDLKVWARNYPKLATVLGIIYFGPPVISATIFAVGGTYSMYVSKVYRQSQIFANMSGKDLSAFCAKYDVQESAVRVAQKEMEKILSKVWNTEFYWIRWGKTKPLRTKADAVAMAAKRREYDDFVEEIRKAYSDPGDVYETLIELADGDTNKMCAALKKAGYSAQDIAKVKELAMKTPIAQLHTDRMLNALRQNTAEHISLSDESLAGARTASEQAAIRLRYEALERRAEELALEFEKAQKLTGTDRTNALHDAARRAKEFQKEISEVENVLPGTRRALAEKIIGEEIAANEKVWSVFDAVHAEPDAAGKRALIRAAGGREGLTLEGRLIKLTSEERSAVIKLARLGIAGNPEVAKTAVTVDRALEAAKSSRFVAKGLITLDVFLTAYFIMDNERQIKAAENAKDQYSAHRGRERRKSLLAQAEGSGLTTAMMFSSRLAPLAGPAAGVLAVGSIASEQLYSYAGELHRQEPDKLPGQSSAELFSNLVDLRENKAWILRWTSDLFEGGSGRAKRRGNNLQEFISRHYESSSQKTTLAIQPALEYLADLTGPEAALDLTVKTQEGMLNYLGVATDIASMYALKKQRGDAHLPLIIDYSPAIGETAVLDLSKLPDDLSDLKNSNDANRMHIVQNVNAVLGPFKQYQLWKLRSDYLVAGEVMAAHGDSIEAWDTAAEIALPRFYKLLAPWIAAADATIEKKAMTPDWKDVVRYVLRTRIQNMGRAFLQLMRDNSIESLQDAIQRYAGQLATMDSVKLYAEAGAETNSLRHASSAGQIEAARMELERSMDDIPLSRCVSALIDE